MSEERKEEDEEVILIKPYEALIITVYVHVGWCHGHLDTNNFYFIFFYFSDFTFIFLYFIFLERR